MKGVRTIITECLPRPDYSHFNDGGEAMGSIPEQRGMWKKDKDR